MKTTAIVALVSLVSIATASDYPKDHKPKKAGYHDNRGAASPGNHYHNRPAPHSPPLHHQQRPVYDAHTHNSAHNNAHYGSYNNGFLRTGHSIASVYNNADRQRQVGQLDTF